MYNILGKYVLRKFFWIFMATTASLAAVSLLVDLIDLLRRAAEKDVSFLTLVGISLVKVPMIISQIIPFCIVIATIITLWRMTKSNELIIYRAVGVSAWKFTAPIIACSFIIGLFYVAIFNPFYVSMYNKHNVLLEKNGFSADTTPFLSEDGFWLRETNDSITSVMFAKNINLENRELILKGVKITNIENDYRLVSRIDAETAVIKDGKINMKLAVEMLSDLTINNLSDLSIPTSIKVNHLEENLSSPEKISVWKMPRVIRFFEKTGFSSTNHKLYFYSVLMAPFTFVAFALIVIPFILTTNQRKGNVMPRLIMAVVASFVLFFFIKIIMALGANASVPIFLAVAIPIIIASILGVVAIMHYEDG